MPKYFFVIVVSAFVLSACGLNLSAASSGTATPFIITATLPSTPIPLPTLTPIPPSAAPTPVPVTGTTSTQLNVRDAPSTAGTPLGMIGIFVKVQIVGKDPGGKWYQILYPQGKDGKGWIVAHYVQVDNPNSIPTIAGVVTPSSTASVTGSAANAINSTTVPTQSAANGTLAPATLPPTITPTVILPAPQDGDSAQAPAVNITFSPSGARSLIYSSDVSAPQGDAKDWIEFTPYSTSVIMALSCTGNGTLQVELQQNGTPVAGWAGLACGASESVNVSQGQAYLLALSIEPAGEKLEHVHYTLSVETPP